MFDRLTIYGVGTATDERAVLVPKTDNIPQNVWLKVADWVSKAFMVLLGLGVDVLTTCGELIMQCAKDIVPEKVSWVWPGVIPLGKLTVFAGDPGVGKSVVSLDAVAHVTTGTAFPDRTQPMAGEAIILSAEDDDEDTLRPRLDAAGADVSKVHIVEAVRKVNESKQHEESVNLVTDLPEVEASLNKHPDVRLIVIDPISAYLGKTDTHRNASMRGVLTPLGKLASKHQVAVLAIDHLNKADKKAIYRVSGSIATVAAARAAWGFVKDRDDTSRRLMLPLKQNLTKDQEGFAYRIREILLPLTPEPILTIRVEWEKGRVTANVNEALSEMAGEDAGELAEAVKWLRGQLTEPQEAAKLRIQAESDGLSWSTVKRAKKELGLESDKVGDHWMWPAVKRTNSEE